MSVMLNVQFKRRRPSIRLQSENVIKMILNADAYRTK